MKTLKLNISNAWETTGFDVTVNEKYINPADVGIEEIVPNRTMTCIAKAAFPDIHIPCKVVVRGYDAIERYNKLFYNLNDAYDYADCELECFACYGDGCLDIVHAETGELLVTT
jgi:hypothetical protein